jgi:serine/threonine-protein kinase
MIEQLGRYRIDGILGKGAMGVVYKGFDPGIERVVALKTIRKEMFSEREQADLIGCFKNEAQAAGRLNHPNIVHVYGYGEDAESAYIVMEFVDGTVLDALLAPARPTALSHVVTWMGGLLGGLQYAHSRGVVHRDVKPANLLITPAGDLKISDFGIARIESSSLTQAGSMIGTPSYMSPEQLLGDAVDGRADVFSAGIVLYQMLTGARPFLGAASVVMQRILNDDPPPPSRILPALGTRFDTVLATAMAKHPDARYPSARAFHEALLAAARQDGLDTDTTVLADGHPTVLAAALPGAVASRATQPTDPMDAAGMDGSGTATTPPWKREALSDIEASLAHQIGPMASFLLNKVADKVEGLDHLSRLLTPHIPSEVGRTQFQQALVRLKKKLDASGTGSGLTHSPTVAAPAGAVQAATAASATTVLPVESVDEAYAVATADRLVAIIGPIGRMVVKRAMKQTGDRQAFLQLIATHIDNPGERRRFLEDARAAPSP